MRKTLVVLSLALFSGALMAGERLSSTELQELYSGKTLFVVHHKNGPTRSFFATDGTWKSLSDDGRERTGKWWIDSDKGLRCVRFDNKNEDYCHYTERNADGTHTLVHKGSGKRLVEIQSTQDGDHL